jgi:hypothetical protein
MIFFGGNGFYPTTLELSLNEPLIIHNQIREYYLGAVFTFVRETPSRKVFTSKGVVHGNFTEVIFKEQGVYTVFFEQYPAKAKITVK